MTGTAATESAEFESIYKLKVTIVPTNKPMIRKVCVFESFAMFWTIPASLQRKPQYLDVKKRMKRR